MPDRGRDLKFSILSEVSRFDVSKAATDLDKLGSAAKTGAEGLDTLTRHSRDTARDVDSSFGVIAGASDRASGKLSVGATRAMGGVRRVFKREGKAAAADLAAAIGNESTLSGAATTMAATVPSLFGPVGIAIGALLSVGLAKLLENWTKTKAEIARQAGELTAAMIAAGGKIDEAFVLDKIKQFAKDGSILQIRDQARDAGVSTNDLVRALAGDEAALGRVKGQLDANTTANYQTRGASLVMSAAATKQQHAIAGVRNRLGEASEAYRIATRASQTAKGAMEKPVHPEFNAAKFIADAKGAYQTVKTVYGRPITVDLRLNAAAARAQAYRVRAELESIRDRP